MVRRVPSLYQREKPCDVTACPMAFVAFHLPPSRMKDSYLVIWMGRSEACQIPRTCFVLTAKE